MKTQQFFDPTTFTFSYVVHAEGFEQCAIIDPVLDYDSKSGRTSTTQADRIIAFVREHQLVVEWILETHAHADHLSAAAYLKTQLGGRIAIGKNIRNVQTVFKGIFNLGQELIPDGSHFDYLFSANEVFKVGPLTAIALAVPGHTPACLAYKFDDAIFVGDTLFMPDVGTARCDFPGGDAATLYESIKGLLAYPDATRLYMCHDYPPSNHGQPTRDPLFHCTVLDQKSNNIHVRDGISQAQFVQMREQRDAGLGMPQLIIPAIQTNIRAGNLPDPESNGVSYMKIPINSL